METTKRVSELPLEKQVEYYKDKIATLEAQIQEWALAASKAVRGGLSETCLLTDIRSALTPLGEQTKTEPLDEVQVEAFIDHLTHRG